MPQALAPEQLDQIKKLEHSFKLHLSRIEKDFYKQVGLLLKKNDLKKIVKVQKDISSNK